MADHSRLDNDARLDRCIKAHRDKMLTAPARGGLGKNATHRSDLGIEMAEVATASSGAAEKAIDLWKAVQKQEPDNARATAAQVTTWLHVPVH